jgi:adenine deaminase
MATLILRNCRLANVYSGEIYPTDITLAGDRIESISPVPADAPGESIDCDGMLAVPGMIDAHMHVDTCFIPPSELARILVPLGTTTLVVDTTNTAHTGGRPAVSGLMGSFAGLPLKGIFAAPSYCPFNVQLETAAVELTSADTERLLADGCVSIGETVWSKIALGDEDYFRSIQICRNAGKRVSGHGGEIPVDDEAGFDAYVTAGIQDDHCLMVGADLRPRLRRGLRMFCVETPGRIGQLERLLRQAKISQMPLRHFCLCVDNITVMAMVHEGFGYQDHLIRIALELGIDPIDAFRMATLNPAEHYRVAHQIGSITPGRIADILLLQAFDKFPPEMVIANGKVVARRGRLLIEVPPPNFPAFYTKTIDLSLVDRAAFAIHAPAHQARARVRVIKVRDGEAFNSAIEAELPVVEGVVHSDLEQDILRMVVVERYGRNGNVGGGFVQGFGLKRGALASSLSVPSNNLVAVGANEDDLWLAVQRLGENQGGLVVISEGRLLAEVLLSFGGIMAAQPFETLIAEVNAAQEVARSLGCGLKQPFFTMAQTVLSTLPDLGLTDRGLVNSQIGKTVPVVLEGGVP